MTEYTLRKEKEMNMEKKCVIGGITVYMTDEDRANWNQGCYYKEISDIRCTVPTSGHDHSCVRDGEVIYRAGLPASVDLTIGEAIAKGLLDPSYYENDMEGCECIPDLLPED